MAPVSRYAWSAAALAAIPVVGWLTTLWYLSYSMPNPADENPLAGMFVLLLVVLNACLAGLCGVQGLYLAKQSLHRNERRLGVAWVARGFHYSYLAGFAIAAAAFYWGLWRML